MNCRACIFMIGALGAHLIQSASGQQAAATSMDGWAVRYRQGQEMIPGELKELRSVAPQG